MWLRWLLSFILAVGSPVQSALLAQLGIANDPGASTPTATTPAIAQMAAPGFLNGLGRQQFQPPAPAPTTTTTTGLGGGGSYTGGGGAALLRDAAAKAGFTGKALDIAVAVAMAESGGDPHNVGDNGTSYGAWQVNLPSHPDYSAQTMLDPYANARAAYQISGGGTNWQPWTMYRNGGYQRYLGA